MASIKAQNSEYRQVLSAGSIASDKVVNLEGETLGNIEDIMIDIRDGRVAYAVLAFGGFMGLGDKLFAIPWSALKVDEDNKCLVLNVDKQKLKQAPGFDKDNWPDMADPTWSNSIRDYYGSGRHMM